MAMFEFAAAENARIERIGRELRLLGVRVEQDRHALINLAIIKQSHGEQSLYVGIIRRFLEAV